jgi:hypothetical protein
MTAAESGIGRAVTDRMSSRASIFLLCALAVSACGTESAECESTLTLETRDRGSVQTIDDGCTSLVVSLARQGEVVLDTVPVVDANVLRFDYLTETAERLDYYFTPVGNGETVVQVGAQPSAFTWTSTVTIALPN